MAESGLLAGVGAALGLVLALGAMPWLERALPPLRDLSARRLALAADFALSWRSVLFAAAVATIIGVVAGLAPAVTAPGTPLDRILRGVRASAGSRGRSAVVVVQVAICTVLLVVAGLLVRTVDELRRVDAGFDRDHVLTFTVDPSVTGYTSTRQQTLVSVLTRRVADMPEVASVAVAWRAVMRGRGIGMTAAAAGERPSAADFLGTNVNGVSPGYFATMGIRFLGRSGFTPGDDPAAKPQKVIVNEAFVRRHFPAPRSNRPALRRWSARAGRRPDVRDCGRGERCQVPVAARADDANRLPDDGP